MRLTCPKCATDIRAKDVNINKLVAVCAQCDNVFGFGDEFPGQMRSVEPIETPRPQNMRVEQRGGELILFWRWLDWTVIPLIGFAVIWNVFMFGFFGGFRGEDNMTSLTPLICPHFWVGLFLIYYILASLFNTTTVMVSHREVKIRHWPFPWRGSKTVEISSLKQLYSGDYFGGNKNRTRYFAVNMVVKHDGHKRLVGGLKSAEHALYIEQEIEKFLGIQDKPVRGELSRRG